MIRSLWWYIHGPGWGGQAIYETGAKKFFEESIGQRTIWVHLGTCGGTNEILVQYLWSRPVTFCGEGSFGIVPDPKIEHPFTGCESKPKPESRNNSPIQVQSLLTNCTYLEDESVEVRKLKYCQITCQKFHLWIQDISFLNAIGLNITGLPD